MKKLVLVAVLMGAATVASASDIYGGIGIGGGNSRTAQLLVGGQVYATPIASGAVVINAEAVGLIANQKRGNLGLAAFLYGGQWQPFLKLSDGGTGYGIGLGAQRDFEKVPLSFRAEVETYSKFAGQHVNVATVSIVRSF